MKTAKDYYLNILYVRLEKDAYDKEYHVYDYKSANQVIRAFWEEYAYHRQQQIEEKIRKMIEENKAKIELAKEDIKDYNWDDFGNSIPVYLMIIDDSNAKNEILQELLDEIKEL